MTKTKNQLYYVETGKYLEQVRKTTPVDGKLLTIGDVCRIAKMSARTYLRIKRD